MEVQEFEEREILTNEAVKYLKEEIKGLKNEVIEVKKGKTQNEIEIKYLSSQMLKMTDELQSNTNELQLKNNELKFKTSELQTKINENEMFKKQVGVLEKVKEKHSEQNGIVNMF